MTPVSRYKKFRSLLVISLLVIAAPLGARGDDRTDQINAQVAIMNETWKTDQPNSPENEKIRADAATEIQRLKGQANAEKAAQAKSDAQTLRQGKRAEKQIERKDKRIARKMKSIEGAEKQLAELPNTPENQEQRKTLQEIITRQNTKVQRDLAAMEKAEKAQEDALVVRQKSQKVDANGKPYLTETAGAEAAAGTGTDERGSGTADANDRDKADPADNDDGTSDANAKGKKRKRLGLFPRKEKPADKEAADAKSPPKDEVAANVKPKIDPPAIGTGTPAEGTTTEKPGEKTGEKTGEKSLENTDRNPDANPDDDPTEQAEKDAADAKIKEAAARVKSQNSTSQALPNAKLADKEECWRTSDLPVDTIIPHVFDKGISEISEGEVQKIYDQVLEFSKKLGPNRKIGKIKAVASASSIPFRTAGLTDEQKAEKNLKLAQARAEQGLKPFEALLFTSGIYSQVHAPNFTAEVSDDAPQVRGKPWKPEYLKLQNKRHPTSKQIDARWAELQNDPDNRLRSRDELAECCSKDELDLLLKPYQSVALEIYESTFDSNLPACLALGASSSAADEKVAEEKIKAVPQAPMGSPAFSSEIPGRPESVLRGGPDRKSGSTD